MSDHEHRSIWGHLTQLAFKQDWIDAGGIRTRYVQAGPSDAPVLIMLHGTGSSWECFCATLQSHSAHFNCLAIDLVGSGFSDKPDTPYEIPYYVEHLRAFMDAMGVQKASMMGVSLGSWISGRFVVTYPERVEKLVLLASSGLIVNKETMGRTIGVRSKAVDDPTWEHIKPVFNSILFEERDRIPDLIQLRQTIYMQPEMKRAMDNILVLQREEVRLRNNLSEDDWRSVQQPLLIILAPDDNPDYLVTGRRIAELAPNARTCEISGVKHWAHYEKPEVFDPVSLGFLLEDR